MLKKPDLQEDVILSRLQSAYGKFCTELTFLPLGADLGTAVYRVATDEEVFFLKLRKGFDELSVMVPLFLKSQGVEEIIPPIETKSKQGWADFGEYKMILYPFVEGKNGFDRDLTDIHKQRLGTALKKIHSTNIPQDIKKLTPQENFSPQGRKRVKSLQALVESKVFDDPIAANLAEFMKSKRGEITRLVQRTEQLASEIRSKPLELVLCHSDFHGGNILISDSGKLYIVDWDNPILAPKERDLMFIGGGIDGIWKTEREEATFYSGYGKAKIDLPLLAYYRYERIIQDLVAYCEQLLLSNEGGADRKPAFKAFASNFKSGSTIDIARKTDTLIF